MAVNTAEMKEKGFLLMDYRWATAPGRTYNSTLGRVETAAGYSDAILADPSRGLYGGVWVGQFISND